MNELQIKYEPFKEIIVMEQTWFSTPEDLARFTNIVAGGKMAGVYWARGISFIYFPLSINTETAARELVEKRRVYWAFLSYTAMPDYKGLIETKEKIIVPVLDMSNNPLFQQVAEWLKAEHSQHDKTT
ncbi:MAG: hypothetical protein JSV64_01900 [Candidatus Bathyarchaeota archaeon]|nr:MAG: hypothetical protein JSV64_01900 [Candidatus Bathyarchaeota archaeon]